MNSFSIAATLAPKGYHKLLTLIFTTIGIKAHGDVRQGGKVMKVLFAVGAGTWCVYLEPTQVYIAQGRPNKAHTTILEET